VITAANDDIKGVVSECAEEVSDVSSSEEDEILIDLLTKFREELSEEIDPSDTEDLLDSFADLEEYEGAGLYIVQVELIRVSVESGNFDEAKE